MGVHDRTRPGHATKQILDNFGEDGWELVQVVPGPGGSENVVAYFKRPKA